MKIDERSLADAQKKYAANVSPRARRLDWLERYAGGTQYEGRASFWNDDVPLQERAPCIVIPIAARAAESNVDLCLGEGRAPTFSLYASEDDSVFDPRLGLNEADAETMTRFIDAVCEQCDLLSCAQELLAWAQIHGTTCAIVGAQNGRLHVSREDAKWATPTFDPKDPHCVESVEIKYPYLEDYTDDAGTLCKRCMIYRRVIDDQRDVTYVPTPANETGKPPDAWIEDRDKTVDHGLGFCPVIWYRFNKHGRHRELDGDAIHALMTDEIDALCLARSQIHRAAVYATDPQIIEVGVDPMYQQGPMGRGTMFIPNAGQIVDADGRVWAPDDPSNLSWRTRGTPAQGSKATKRGPGVTWRYEHPESKVSLLTLPGDALKPAEDNYSRLYAMIKEMLGVVFVDPEQTKLGSDISGRALEWLHSKQIDRCNRIRKDFGRGVLTPLIHMLMRVVLKTSAALYVPGIDKARKILTRFEQEVEGADNAQWFGPDIKITWGPYFTPTAADAKADTDNAIAALQGGLITLRTAVEKMRQHYPDIGDVGQYLEALDEEAEEKAAKFHAAAAALMPPGEDDAQEGDEMPVPGKPPIAKKAKTPPQVPPPKPGKVREPVPPKAKKPPVARKKVAAAGQAA